MLGEGRPAARKRQAAVDRTRAAVLAAARELVAAGHGHAISVGAVAQRAGVSRLTIYNRFGSRAGLLRELAGEAHRRTPEPRVGPPESDAREELRQRFIDACALWGSEPALFRGLPAATGATHDEGRDRGLAERLAGADQLRPGCSIKEAEDVIGVLTSFDTFDRLHRDGRRSPAVVADMLMRLAGAILA